jgi:microcystin-dependent protein
VQRWAYSAQQVYAATGNVQLAGDAIAAAGAGQPHDNMSPYLGLNFIIALQGIYPARN